MKYFVLPFFVLLPTLFHAQSTQTNENARLNKLYYERIMETEGADFETTEVPEEWKDEPMVILCEKNLNASELLPGVYRHTGITRKRILIQDRSVLDEFSEFYYQASEAIGVTLIKPDGKEIEIDLKGAVSVETEVPRIYRNKFRTDKYYKIAVPNLEVGDIIDFYKVYSQKSVNKFEMISQLADDYPIVFQKIIIDYDKRLATNYKTFNGAPKFSWKGKSGIPYLKEDDKRTIRRYTLVDSLRNKQKIEQWNYANTNEPTIKLEVYYNDTRGGLRRLNWKEKFKKAASPSTADLYKSPVNKLRNDIRKRLYLLNDDFAVLNEAEKINLIYRAIRYEFIAMQADPSVYTSIISEYYMYLFSHFLTDSKIKHELVIGVPRYYGTMEQVVLKDELEYGIYIPSTDKFYWTIDNYSVAGEANERLNGTNGFKAKKPRKGEFISKFDSIYIPESRAADNLSSTRINITFNEDNSLNFSNRVTYTGAYKPPYLPLFLVNTDYLKQEELALSKASVRKRAEKKRAADKASKNKRKIELAKERAEIDDLKTEGIKDMIASDFEIEDLVSYELISNGITNKTPDLIFDYEFTSKGYVTKAGANLVLELGSLISSQVELEEEVIKERTKDVYYDFARAITNDITIELPEGYTVKGLNQFNIKKEYPHSAFITTATQEGSKLIMKTTKVYKNQTIPVEHWPQLVEMLEAAYNFTQQKVVLVKIR